MVELKEGGDGGRSASGELSNTVQGLACTSRE